MNEKIDNKELIKRILERLHKADNTNFSVDELAEIEDIAFTKKLVNGKDTGISINNIFIFKNLRCLTLRSYSVTMEDLLNISKHPTIEDISFLECAFDDVDFDNLPRIPEMLKFLNCSNLPLKFPRVKKVMVGSCEIDFNSIDFESSTSIIIQNSRIKNVHNINQYDNLLEVNLDGSELIQENGEIVADINVSDKCKYSHREIDRCYIDDYSSIKHEEMEK